MPRPGRFNPADKSKDFAGSMKRLIKSLGTWKILLIIALFLAMISAVFSIISPNILSKFTDTITDGLKPDMEKVKDISNQIVTNVKNINYQDKMTILLNSNNISNEEKLEIMDNIQNNTFNIMLVSDAAKEIIIGSIEIDGVTISAVDQVKFLELMQNMQSENYNDALNSINELPESIYSIIKPSIDMKRIKSIAITLATLYMLSALFGYVQSFSMATISNNFAKKLRNNISHKINKLPLKYFDNHETGDVLSRVTNDVDTVSMNMNQSLATLVSSTTLFIGSIIMMFVTEWRMALTAIFASVLGFVGMFLILKKSQKYFIQRQEQLGDLNGYIEEIYSGLNVVKAYNESEKSYDEFKKLNQKLYNSNKKSQFLSGIMQPIMGFVGNLGYVAVCVVGALLVSNGNINFGVIVAFMIYVRLFTNPLSQIAQAMTALQSTAAASERVFEFLDEQEQKDESHLTDKLLKEDVKGAIEFKNVVFGYDSDRTIIKNFNASVKPGQKVAIVGPTGAGKTTMVNLLMKFYEINSGDILIDGKSIHDLTRENIHDLFVMVLQDTWLFDGSVKENIIYNKENITEEDVWNASKVVGIDHFIKTLPEGMDTVISDNDSVSQGQKQLLTITRGMIENAPFLILDEATSNVDTRTEELVQKAMDKLTEGRTSFIIAHRLSTIKNADLILVMKDGDIIESGTHDSLMKKDGFYAELYNSQFEL